MKRVVIDTNVLVSSVLTPNPDKPEKNNIKRINNLI